MKIYFNRNVILVKIFFKYVTHIENVFLKFNAWCIIPRLAKEIEFPGSKNIEFLSSYRFIT